MLDLVHIIQPSPVASPAGRRPKRKRSFSELSWSEYFNEQKFVEVRHESQLGFL